MFLMGQRAAFADRDGGNLSLVAATEGDSVETVQEVRDCGLSDVARQRLAIEPLLEGERCCNTLRCRATKPFVKGELLESESLLAHG